MNRFSRTGIAGVCNFSLFFLLVTLQIPYVLAAAMGQLYGIILEAMMSKRTKVLLSSSEQVLEVTKFSVIFFVNLVMGLVVLYSLVQLESNLMFANSLVVLLTMGGTYGLNRFIQLLKPRL